MAKHLFCEELSTVHGALSAEAPTAYASSLVFIVHDELCSVNGPDSELYAALETSIRRMAQN